MGHFSPDTKPPSAPAGAIATAYRGRFAPTPSGPLHFGGLIALVGSYLDARSVNGAWHVRIEDIDLPRVVVGAADDILRTINKLGIGWDGPVCYQSRRESNYREAIARLKRDNMLYPCACSRQEIADTALSGVEGPVYPGTCRNGLPQQRMARTRRLRTHNEPIEFHDLRQGVIRQRLETEIGDFVVRRADGLVAYQLAVVVDDADLQVSHVVRGGDLLLSTPRQIYLQQLLHLPTPRYLHLPVAVNAKGQKLSKQTHALPLNHEHPLPELIAALRFLGQEPPDELAQATLDEFWRWGTSHWNRRKIPSQRTLSAPTLQPKDSVGF